MEKPSSTSIVDYINEYGKKSCRKLAAIFNRSKSSVHRRQQKIGARAQTPGAVFFETQQGQEWLMRLVVAIVFVFGIRAGVGSETVSLFFSIICISSFMAVSTSSLKRLENRIDDVIAEYKVKYDGMIREKAPELSITPGGDETFFENMMMLVCMDLESGFIFHETITENRDHKTWEAVSTPWLSSFKTLRCFLSDKAKALLKLANTNLGIDQIPDLFHMMHDVSKVMRYSFHRLKTSTEKSLNEAKEKLSKGIDAAINKGIIATASIRLQLLSRRQAYYQKSLRRLSTALHPFAILSSNKQTAAIAEDIMQSNLRHIKGIRDELDISDSQKRLDRVERQIPDAAKQVDLWWQWVNTSLESADMTSELKQWLTDYLLPFVYWKSRISKTDSEKIKRVYTISMNIAENKLIGHPLTAQLLMDNGKSSLWQTWAEKMSGLFIRTTSAIEGRNSWLSQIHFNGRGLSDKRVASQTAIHNYYAKRYDDTTACERLSGIKPEDMFEFIIDNVGVLASPRKRQVVKKCNLLNLKSVPA